MARSKSSSSENQTASLGFEAKLGLAADKLRNNMDAAEYKHVVLGLIFLKYISDSFEEMHAKLTVGIPDATRTADIIKRLLSNLRTIGKGLSELLLLYGKDRGQHRNSTRLTVQPATLSVGVAATPSVFIFETHKEIKP